MHPRWGYPKTSQGRRSAVNPGTARNAADPINAPVNYRSRLLETDGHLATVTVGLDPGLGISMPTLEARRASPSTSSRRHVLWPSATSDDFCGPTPSRWRDFH